MSLDVKTLQRIEELEADVASMARAKEAAELQFQGASSAKRWWMSRVEELEGQLQSARDRADEGWTRVGELETALAQARGEA